MKKYYLMAIEKGHNHAMYNLGKYYEEQKDYDNMKKYYLMAIEKGHNHAMYNLGKYYEEQKDYDNMKKYYLMAIEKGHSGAMNNLGTYYKEQKDYDNMTQYYLMAIKEGHSSAMINLGNYYKKQKEFYRVDFMEDWLDNDLNSKGKGYYNDYYKINYLLKNLFDNSNTQIKSNREYAKEALDKYYKCVIYNLVKKELENNTSFRLFYEYIRDDIINKLTNSINLYNDAKLLFEKNLINYKKQLLEYAKLYAIGIKDPSYLNVK
jgi:hypothetical protein